MVRPVLKERLKSPQKSLFLKTEPFGSFWSFLAKHSTLLRLVLSSTECARTHKPRCCRCRRPFRSGARGAQRVDTTSAQHMPAMNRAVCQSRKTRARPRTTANRPFVLAFAWACVFMQEAARRVALILMPTSALGVCSFYVTRSRVSCTDTKHSATRAAMITRVEIAHEHNA